MSSTQPTSYNRGFVLVLVSFTVVMILVFNIQHHEKPRLVLAEGKAQVAVPLRPGDVLELRPFSHPVLPKFISAKLETYALGDRCLEPIGDASGLSSVEGPVSRSYFFRAREPGQVTIWTRLVGRDGDLVMGPISCEVRVAR